MELKICKMKLKILIMELKIHKVKTKRTMELKI